MTIITAGHIIMTRTQPVGRGRPQRGLKPGPSHQESCALPTELSRPQMDSKKLILILLQPIQVFSIP